MSGESKIEWTDSTFNPWIGCTKVSPGCDHCYAEAWERRFAESGHATHWGPGKARRRTSESNWRQPVRWNAAHDAFLAEHGRRRRVFCASLADVFDNEVPDHWRWDLFRVIAATPNLDWLLLTKRIGNARTMLNEVAEAVEDDFVGASTWDRSPWANVWIGATVVNQDEADRDIPKLLDTPAAVRFISIEPMLGDIHLGSFLQRSPSAAFANGCVSPDMPAWTRIGATAIDWVICGGESGRHARPMHPDWARSLRDECSAAGVPFLFKQWGEWLPWHHFTDRRKWYPFRRVRSTRCRSSRRRTRPASPSSATSASLAAPFSFTYRWTARALHRWIEASGSSSRSTLASTSFRSSRPTTSGATSRPSSMPSGALASACSIAPG